ncbi:MAG: (2Fe-2S)-binding protein [Thermoplasmata archaeon]|nr:MAG: (2Fe-2S)-binding protein [Thermoplasmata archaeon]KAA0010580.1 MAG: (2Fe-2S)-binding protein [Thermoplasmata archaeon]RLF52771.1 MAG: (2Fe-2S)-binding protein [Thermoplasmata archaeon]
MSKKIVCRCEDVTEEDILKAIDEGYTDFEELRKKLRIGMGTCQGRTCIMLALRILARKTGKSIEEIEKPSFRPPVVPITLGSLAGEEDEG